MFEIHELHFLQIPYRSLKFRIVNHMTGLHLISSDKTSVLFNKSAHDSEGTCIFLRSFKGS